MEMAFFSQPLGDRIRDIDSGIAISHFAFAVDARGYDAAHEILRKLKIPFDPPEEFATGKVTWFMDLCGRRVEIAASYE
jgi:hypothetical protein